MPACISGTGSYLPAKALSNDDVCALAAGTSDAWIRERLGIVSRREASDDEDTSDLAARAVARALEAAQLAPADVDGVICAVGTGDVPTPATAAYVQRKVGIHNRCFAFDIKMACAGSVGGVHLARGLIEAGMAEHVVIVGTAIMRRTTIDVTDRSCAAIFGDGAGACVVSRCAAGEGILQSTLRTDGALTELVVQPMGGSREPLTAEGIAQGRHLLQMQGREVWDCATKVVPEAIAQVLHDEGLAPDEVDFFISHQANRNLVHEIMRRAGIPTSRTHTNMERYGNTVAASALIALDEAVRGGRIGSGDLVLLCAMGAGMSWGAHLMRWAS